MADIKRTAEAVWNGELRSGRGEISSPSGVLAKTPYSFGTRFEGQPGTNPEELIAAAHAACYSMALAATLGRAGHQPQQVKTRAVCTLQPQQPSGFRITKMRLETEGTIPGIDDATFQKIAAEAEQACPVSNALRGSLEIELDAKLNQAEASAAAEG
ncbi:MAG: OsmC family protein [Pyrinomonadaceae bacterium]|nr:OsmC family protein [Pyrinomonadaceae bacterium]